jgi:hypothetical protein
MGYAFKDVIVFINFDGMPMDKIYQYVEGHIYEYAKEEYSEIFYPNTSNQRIIEILQLDTLPENTRTLILRAIRTRVPYRPY